jgi:FAD/FMN-containing dehydrogenase/Fe-S oxidoreductase
MAEGVVQQVGFADDVERGRHARGLAALTRGEVRFGAHDRMLYATDASIYQVEPLGVVIPADVEEVPGIVRYCAEHGLPILPRGGGTSLAGQCVNRAVVLDLSARCTQLEWVDVERRACGVEPGITIDDLNDQLRARGHELFFAPDPATARQCTIGGAIGNNAAGTRSILYGRTSESVEAVSAVLADGAHVHLGAGVLEGSHARVGELTRGVIGVCTRYERLIRERFPKTVRRNAGYGLDMVLAGMDEAARLGRDPMEVVNLAKLICGSEGTLAVVTGATLKLHPAPKAKGLAVIGFASLDEAIEAVRPMLALGPSAVELLDDLVIGLARENTEYRKYAELMPQPRTGTLEAVLYVEFFSTTGPEEIAEKMEAVRAIVEHHHPTAGFAALTNASEMAQALKLRKAGEPLLHGIPGKRKPLGFVEDNAVPVERLGEFVKRFRAILDREGTRGAFWAHASVGVLHVRPLLDPRDAEDLLRMERIAVDVADLAKSLGGVMSGEHGDGRVRGPLLERYYGPELMGAFREVKALFDPRNLLNPGNIVEPGPIASIHETLRVRPMGANVEFPEVSTYFDYSEAEGFDHAVELCNGSGVCRKKQGGTMCPSYMATLDERHSTRGRGNALRLAISGQMGATPHLSAKTPTSSPPSGEAGGPERGEEGRAARARWNDAETLETLGLCLSCKACKTECPSNVDIAKYKAEYLAQGYRARGTPLGARVLGNVRLLNRVGSMFAPVSNWAANSWPARMVNARMLGISPKRRLPAFARSVFKAPGHGAADGAPVVVLFGDCFTAYNEPGIGVAAVKVLRACGYRVVVADAGCCGRAAISTGLLPEAARMIGATAARLVEVVDRERAVAVVVAEPSCLSAIKDEWRTLKGGAPRDVVDRLAGMSWLVEDFVDARWDAHPVRPVFRAPDEGGEIVVHGHCHQKALWGAETSARLMRRIGGARVRVLDSGCCGMAGSFGYMRESYALSMRIGEMVVFPAARAMGATDVMAAPGTSCRHQVKDGTGKRALHPIEIAGAALGEEKREA